MPLEVRSVIVREEGAALAAKNANINRYLGNTVHRRFLNVKMLISSQSVAICSTFLNVSI